MAKVIEIKTQNCPRCKMFEPTYKEIQNKYPNNEYVVLIFGVDPEAQVIATKYNIKSAPTFVIEQENKDSIVVKQEELESTLKDLQ